MPATLAIAVPQNSRAIDLRDAVDATDRGLETAQSTVAQVQSFMRKLQNPGVGAGHGAGYYAMPSNIVASSRTTYEGLVDDVLDDLTSALTNYAAIIALQA